ncbi:MAG TPA: hypothetical protein DEP88_05095 [Verrucomicrobiales bacterium]|jgi:hypothetical protein|nr:hypothetical protein [Verrucomicrobiales bacterium]HCL96564.1 hypothetical protein [Verrucomicrobiales bacterium]
MKSLFNTFITVLCLTTHLSPLSAHSQVHHNAPVTDMTKAAELLIISLNDTEKKKALFKWSDNKRQGWHFVPDKFIKGEKMRHGLSIKKMNPRQRILAHALLSSGLSNKGYLQASTIMSLEQILHDLENNNPIRDPQLYYVSIFGKPSSKSTWSWRFEGHHLSLNFTIVNGNHISVTPSFFGTNPGQVKKGIYKGIQVLKTEESLAFKLVNSLTPEQRKAAIIDVKAPHDVITGQDRKVNKGLFLPVKGIAYNKLNNDQQKILLNLTNEYASKYRADILKSINARAKIGNGKDMHFAWAGSTQLGHGHYYRIQTPKWLFEYDNTQNGANHAHAVWRDFNGDFGADLLHEHHENAHAK